MAVSLSAEDVTLFSIVDSRYITRAGTVPNRTNMRVSELLLQVQG